MFFSPDPHTPLLGERLQAAFAAKKDTLGHPCYVYDAQHIRRQIEQLRTWHVPGGVTIRYAMKANPLKGILRIMQEQGVYIDACSDYEAWRALAAGTNPDHIQITGQTRPTDLPALVNQGVRFCACSLGQLEKFGKLFPGKEVGIRINPGIGSGQFPGVNVGGHRSSFGIWHTYISQVLALAKKYDLHITVLHTHIGSGSDPYIWQEVAHLSLNIAKHLQEVRTVNLGGGLKVARMLDEKAADVIAIGKKITDAFTHFQQETGRVLHLEIEPGTYLVANAGYLASAVDDVVDTGSEGETFVKLTIGMSEIIRPIMYGARHPIWIDTSLSDQSLQAIVVGHSCESSDMLTVDTNGVALHRRLPQVRVGDCVLIGGVGAYCSSMRAVHYNSYPRIAEYLLEDKGELICLREAEDMETVWHGEL